MTEIFISLFVKWYGFMPNGSVLLPQLIFLAEDICQLSFFKKANFSKQKQPFKGVLRKRCSENLQQIYRKTPMLKYDSNKTAQIISKLDLDLCSRYDHYFFVKILR